MIGRRFIGTAMLGSTVIIAALAGCSDGDNPLCCTEFKVGGTIEANIGGGGQGQVAAQAVADLGGIASAAVDDLTTACRNMAQDLDAPADKRNAAEATADKRERMKAWCNLAVAQITSIKAGATLQIVFQPPRCEASISAKANCQAKCSVDGKCDIKATPPKCEGGKLSVACKGECTAKAGATLSCTGSCTGTCSGSCTAQGGVECAGACEGTCEASAGGSGPQADGTCKGSCKGTCKVTAPNVQCSGTCSGTCSASCKGSAEASVTCDGECKADYEPLRCEGGKLTGGCQVDAKCDANCDASVNAKAQCTPPDVRVTITGGANAAAIGKLRATLDANLGIVLGLRERLKLIANFTGNLEANVKGVADVKAACIPPIIAAVGTAVQDVGGSVEAAASITASVGAQ